MKVFFVRERILFSCERKWPKILIRGVMTATFRGWRELSSRVLYCAYAV